MQLFEWLALQLHTPSLHCSSSFRRYSCRGERHQCLNNVSKWVSSDNHYLTEVSKTDRHGLCPNQGCQEFLVEWQSNKDPWQQSICFLPEDLILRIYCRPLPGISNFKLVFEHLSTNYLYSCPGIKSVTSNLQSPDSPQGAHRPVLKSYIRKLVYSWMEQYLFFNDIVRNVCSTVVLNIELNFDCPTRTNRWWSPTQRATCKKEDYPSCIETNHSYEYCQYSMVLEVEMVCPKR